MKLIKWTVVVYFLMTVVTSVTLASGLDEYTKLLIQSDTTNGDVVVTDSSGDNHLITTYGYVQHSTAYSKFGDSSIYFNGYGTYLSIQDSEEWNFANEKFTIDFWIKSTSTYGIFQQRENSDTEIQLFLGGGMIQFRVDTPSVAINLSSGVAVNDNQWHHVAVWRNGSSFCLAIDGVVQSQASSDLPIDDISAPIEIGRYNNTSGQTYYLNGYIDEFRITKGTARWTEEDFIPPDTSYSAVDRCPDGIEAFTVNGKTYINKLFYEKSNQAFVKEKDSNMEPNPDDPEGIYIDQGDYYGFDWERNWLFYKKIHDVFPDCRIKTHSMLRQNIIDHLKKDGDGYEYTDDYIYNELQLSTWLSGDGPEKWGHVRHAHIMLGNFIDECALDQLRYYGPDCFDELNPDCFDTIQN